MSTDTVTTPAADAAIPAAAFTPAFGVWHKANPPFTAAQLQDSERSPSWVDEFTKMTGVAADLTFGAITDEVIDQKIQALFSVSIPPTNKTLIALRNQVYNVLSVLRPEWYDQNNGELFAVLPEGVDGRSKVAIKAIEDAKLAADRKQKAADAALKRRIDERAAIRVALDEAKTKIGTGVDKVIEVVGALPFEEAKAVLTTDLGTTLEALGFGQIPYASQVVFAGLPEEWFKVLIDGTLKLRDSLPKGKPTGPNRHQKALLRVIFSHIEKHTRGSLIDTLHMLAPGLSFAGVDFVSKDVLLPEIVVTEDEGTEPETVVPAAGSTDA